jgi:hypothetical protein
MKKSLLYHVNTSLTMPYYLKINLLFNYMIFSIKFLVDITLNKVHSFYIFDHIIAQVFHEEIYFIFEAE